MIDQRTWPLRVCEACLSDRYEVNDSVAKTFVCTDCGHESKTVRTLTVQEVPPHDPEEPPVRSKPIHMTPTEMGREFGMHRREVIAKCMELGVPIFQGRIDRKLFAAKLSSPLPGGTP